MFGVQTILSTLVLAAVPSSQDATLLFATTPGCAPCRQVAPLIQELVQQGYSVETIDASQHPDIIRELKVDRFPTFLMLSDETIIDRVVGGGDPIILKPRILQMFQLAAQRQRKTVAPLASLPAPMPQEAAPAPRTASAIPATFASSGSGIANAAFIAPSVPPETAAPAVVPVSFAQPRHTSTTALSSSSVFPPSAESQSAVSDTASPLILSSVKLRVDAENAHSWGTGTIIDTRNGEALILTCGHIFRDSKGQGQVEVHLFGPASSAKVFGRCLYYDLEIDLALVAIAPPCPVRAVPIAPISYQVRSGRPVLSVGCDGGANPTVRSHQILSTDRIGTPRTNTLPFHYIQVSGAPVGGRSGGGLFTEEGYLVGVCNTADPVENDGHFVPPQIIRHVLKQMRLETVYENPSLSNAVSLQETRSEQPSPSLSPSALEPLAPIQNSPSPIDQALNEPIPDFQTSNQGMNAVEQATLDEIRRRTQDGDEVILIVRSRRNPEIPSDVIVLNGPSDQFLDALAKRPAPSDEPPYNPVIFSSRENAAPPALASQSIVGPRTVSFPVAH